MAKIIQSKFYLRSNSHGCTSLFWNSSSYDNNDITFKDKNCKMC